MRRLFTICLLALSATALLVSAPAASAAKKAAKTPSITRVTPMRISVGNVLTIRGRNFKPQRRANTVIFRAPNGRTAFAKPRRASRTKLVVVVPEAVSRLLRVANNRQRPTRLKLRVLAGRFSKYTSRRLSPVVTGIGDGDGNGPGDNPAKVCVDDSDHDNDLLSNDLEKQIGTDACLPDTDKDQMTDGWEYYAARDLNIKAVPYPGKRPFPNALDPCDGGVTKDCVLVPNATFGHIDFDGDGLTTLEEYRAWRYTGSSFDTGFAGGTDLGSPLGYSDGTKFSRSGETPPVPAWRSASYGVPNPTQPFPATYDLFGDAAWRDGERDADNDGLNNRMESARGPMTNGWWAAFWASDRFDPAIKPFEAESYCGYRPGHFTERPFADLDIADPDVDGDTLLDGEDDQDNDDVNNIAEMYEVDKDLDGDGNTLVCDPADPFDDAYVGVMPSMNFNGSSAPVNAMNPCVPNPQSRTCLDYIMF
jgi:hypothetical protein